MTDYDYMKLALELAAKGRGQVSPNPMVGAVLVRPDLNSPDGLVVGRGYYRYEGRKHAEIRALEDAGHKARGATLYVTLEPCNHHGRTPPCADAVIAAGVKRVVAAMADPNPLVAGHGLERLRAAGIHVEIGFGGSEAERLNEKFIRFHTTGRPFVQLKVAQSLDGRIATRTGASKWITSPAARQAAHELRFEYDAILVGIGTVLADDPALTVRLDRSRHRPLVRVVLDQRLQLPVTSRLAQTANETPVLLFTESPDAPQAEALIKAGVTIIKARVLKMRLRLDSILHELAQRGITSLLVEGGAETNSQFLTAGLVDKVTFFIAPKLIGGRTARGAIGGEGIEELSEAIQLDDLTVRPVGPDWEATGYPKWDTGA